MEEEITDLAFERELRRRIKKAKVVLKRCNFCDAELIFLAGDRGQIVPLNTSLNYHPVECPGLQKNWAKAQNGTREKPKV
jgi:hypothetical protein